MIKYYVQDKEWAGGSFESLLWSVNCYCAIVVPCVPRGWATSCPLQTLCLDYPWALKCYIRWGLVSHFMDAFGPFWSEKLTHKHCADKFGSRNGFWSPKQVFKEPLLVAAAAAGFFMWHLVQLCAYVQCCVNLFLKFVVITVKTPISLWLGFLCYFSQN